jgi:hypothetical protein
MTVVDSNNWSTRSLNIFNNTYSLPTQYSPTWGVFLIDNAIQDQGLYEFDIRFLEQGIQVFGTAADDDCQFYIDGEYLGDFGPINDNQRIFTTKYYDAFTVHRLTFVRTDGGVKPTAIAARWIRSEYSPVDIDSFDAAPRVLTNTANTTLVWAVTNARKIEIDQNVGDVTEKTQQAINTRLQSISGLNSPASKIYTLTAFGNAPSDIQTAIVEVLVFNDRTPNNIDIPHFYNREPNEIITYNLPALSGIDAPITVSGDDFVLVTSGVSQSFTRSITVNNNATIRIRFPAPDFSQDPATLDNTVEYYVDIGTLRKYFTVTTRAPRDDEIFDFGDIKNSVPYPAPPGNDENPPEYLVSPDTVEPTAEDWEVELQNPNNVTFQSGVEVKTTYNDQAQVRVRPFGGSWGSWVNTEYLYDEIVDPGPRTIEDMIWNTIGTRDSGDINNPNPRSVNTRSAGILTGKNIV